MDAPEHPSPIDMAHMPSVKEELDAQPDRIVIPTKQFSPQEGESEAFALLNGGRGAIVTGRVDTTLFKFRLAIPERGKELGDTLSRNALSLEIRTGFRFPRNEMGGYLKFSSHEETVKAYKQFFRAVQITMPDGIPCDCREQKGVIWKGIFREQDLLTAELALGREDEMEDISDIL